MAQVKNYRKMTFVYIILSVIVISTFCTLLDLPKYTKFMVINDMSGVEKTNGVLKRLNKTGCEWYYEKDWWRPFNNILLKPDTTKWYSVSNMYEMEEMYNYSIPVDHINTTKLQKYTKRDRVNKADSLASTVSCVYKGKIFNIGIQKTGTTSVKEALQRLNYRCNRYTLSNIRFSCRYHLVDIDGYYVHNRNMPRDWNLFSLFNADDISFAFINTSYTKDLYLASYVSEVFADQPWAYLYPIFDKWYPSSKFIYTVRKSTYTRVNSAIKFELFIRFRQRELTNGTLEWNGTLEHELIGPELLEEFIMLNARVYEKHHANVLNYFDASRIGAKINNDLLILCIECEQNPWGKIFNFLGCKIHSNETIDDIQFPHKLSSDKSVAHYSLPKHISLDWNNYTFGKYTTDLLNIIYNQTKNKRERFNDIIKKIWRLHK